MDKRINIFIENEKSSNVIYKYNKLNNKLVIKQLINKPYVYPYPTGFIPNTENENGNELSAIIITNNNLKKLKK